MSDPSLPAICGGEPTFPEGPPEWPGPNPEVREALLKCWQDGSWGRYAGPAGERLLEQLAARTGCRHVLLTSSGTAAVELALRGLKLGDDFEVLLSAYDFKGNFQNVLSVGGRPVLVDVEPGRWWPTLEAWDQAVDAHTRAVIVSHLHGALVPMRELVAWAHQRELVVIEDACQVPGATVQGRPAGSWGDVGVLSFGGSKLLSAGRGGALFTSRADVVQRCRLWTARGNEAYPLSELQAAVLLPQLDQLDEHNQLRRDRAAQLRQGLAVAGVEAERCAPESPLAQDSQSLTTYFKLALVCRSSWIGNLDRGLLLRALQAEGVACYEGFRSLHRIHTSRRFRAATPLEQADRLDDEIAVLHHPLLLEDRESIDRLTAAVGRILEHAELIREQAASA